MAALLSGSLVVVGTGIGPAQLTLEARAAIQAADEVLYLVATPLAAAAALELSPGARSLEACYGNDGPSSEAYERMVDEILAPVRAGKRVCAAFYGHPGVFVLPSNEAIARARTEGFAARMLPGISAEDCLFADLGVDPARDGLQSYEASAFLRRSPAVEPTAALVLWQVGVLGDRTADLAERLLGLYPAGHEAVVYQASPFPGIEPLVRRVQLGKLEADAITPSATLFVPAARR